MAILSLLLIQAGQLSVTGKSIGKLAQEQWGQVNRAVNVHHSHMVFLKFSTAIFKSSDSLHLDCIKLNWFACFCWSFVCVCHWMVSLCSYLPDKKV